MEVTKSCCMKKNRLFCLFILLVLVGGVSAQLVEKVREFLAEEDTMKTVPVIRTDSDSIKYSQDARGVGSCTVEKPICGWRWNK